MCDITIEMTVMEDFISSNLDVRIILAVTYKSHLLLEIS